MTTCAKDEDIYLSYDGEEEEEEEEDLRAADMQETFREGTKECKKYILEDLLHLCDKKQFYQLIRIFYFGKK